MGVRKFLIKLLEGKQPQKQEPEPVKMRSVARIKSELGTAMIILANVGNKALDDEGEESTSAIIFTGMMLGAEMAIIAIEADSDQNPVELIRASLRRLRDASSISDDVKDVADKVGGGWN